MNQTELLEEILLLARQAGSAIMGIYEKDFNVEYKADESPVTDADLAAHKVIVNGLKHLTPDVPILSEESADISWEVRQTWQRYWLVDPIDGTMNFSRTNPIFCISVGYVENGEPIWGLIYNPVLKELIKGSEEGLFLNGNSFTRENITDPKQAILSTGIPTYLNIDDNGFFQYLSTMKTFKKIRMIGSAAQSVA